MIIHLSRFGVEVCGVLSPWEEFQEITLSRELAIHADGQEIAPAYWVVCFETVSGDVLEVTEDGPNWAEVLADLPSVLPLLKSNLAAVMKASEEGIHIALWRARDG